MAEFHNFRSETRNWDLSTDEKLLTKLDTFLNNMLGQCEIIQKNTDLAHYETNAVSVYLSDTFNALSNLSNKKFVENSMAPVEETQITMRETKRPKEITSEHKQENYQKAVANAVELFNITNNDDDDTLSKSHTMSMSSMFRNADNLPPIIGSKVFSQDEFIGIVERTEDLNRYLRGMNKEALDEDPDLDFQGNQGYGQNGFNDPGISSTNSFIVGQNQVYNANPNSNKIGMEIRDTRLGPPPPLQELLAQYDGNRKGSAITMQRPVMNLNEGRGNLLGEIANRGPPRGGLMDEIKDRSQSRGNLMDEINRGPPRGNLMDEINNRGQPKPNLMDEINNRGQPRMNLMDEINNRGQPKPNLMDQINSRGQQRPNLMEEINQGRNKTIQETLNEQISNRNRPAAGDMPPANMMSSQYNRDGRSESISSIKNNPLYQPLQTQATKQNRLFDEDEDDVEVGNRDLFKSASTNKKKFENLLSNPSAGLGNPMMNSMLNPMSNASPFDPFGLSNPFMPFNPKGGIQPAPMPQLDDLTKRPDRTNPMMKLADESSMQSMQSIPDVEKKEEKAAKTNKLNKLFEDSDEDDDMRLSKQKMLSQKYRTETKPKVEEKPVVQPPPKAATNRVSKLFDDDDDAGFLPTKKTEPAPPRLESSVATKTTKKKLFDEEDATIKEDDDDLKKSQADKKKEDSLGLRTSTIQKKPTVKNTRGSLFNDDDDDDAPFGGAKKATDMNVSKRKEKKTLFDDEDEDEKPQPLRASKAAPASSSHAPVLNKKKSLFEVDEEIVEEKPIVQETKPVVTEVKPIVREEPKPQPQVIQPVKEEIKPKVEEIRPLTEPPKDPEPDVRESFLRANPANLTQLIKASQMNKRKKSGSSSEENSDSDSDRRAPIKKPVEVAPAPTKVEEEAPRKFEPEPIKEEVVQHYEAPRVEEPIQHYEPMKAEEPVQHYERPRAIEEPVVRQEEPVVQYEYQNTQPQMFSTHSEEPVVQPEEAHPHKISEDASETNKVQEDDVRTSLQPKQNVSSKISALQNMLNLNLDTLKPNEGLPTHMRKSKPSFQLDESNNNPSGEPQSSGHKEQSNPLESYTTGPDGLSHAAALAKPTRQTRAKKTITFDDDDEENEKPTKTASPSKPVEQPRPVAELPKQEESILRTSKMGVPADLDDPMTRPSVSNNKKKVTFGQEDLSNDPLGFGGAKPASSGSDNPLNLLSGLKALDEKKGSRKSQGPASYNDESYDNRPSLPKPTMGGSDNPLALLSGLKDLDAQQGRKSSTKGKSAKSIFDDDDDSNAKPKSRASKGKGIFDDDDNGGGFVPKSSGGPNVRDLQEPKTVETKQKESKRLTKLFNDSDEDEAPKKVAPPVKKTVSKGKSKLFDDSD